MDTCPWCYKEVQDAEQHLAETPRCRAAQATAEAVEAGLDYPVTLGDRVALVELKIAQFRPTAAGPFECENEMWGPKSAITLLAHGYTIRQLRDLLDGGGVRALDLAVTAMAIAGENLPRRQAGNEDGLADIEYEDDDCLDVEDDDA